MSKKLVLMVLLLAAMALLPRTASAQFVTSLATCVCDEPGGGVGHNHFRCYDSYGYIVADRWCASDPVAETCYGTSTGDWPCTPTTPYYYDYYDYYYYYTYPTQQYGNLNVRVTDCMYGTPIGGAYVNAMCAADPSGYTDGSGYANFYSIPAGGCSITASASGYTSQSTSANIQCSQTAYASVCLNRIVTTTTTTTVPWCSAGFTGVYQCSGNWLQQQYRNSDCSYSWTNQQYCSYGCSGNSCVTQQCTSGYTDSYRCDGNWRQRLYKNADCSVYWSNVEYCPGTCSPDRCTGICGATVSATTPTDAYTGESVSTTVSLFNYGDAGGYVTVNPFVCKDDGSYCSAMNCAPGTIYVGSRSSAYLTCTKSVASPGYYKIKVDYSGCGSDPAVYSSVFHVTDRFQCSPRTLDSYQCFGDDLKQEYQNADCGKSWQLVEHCDDGCTDGKCKEKTSAIPLVSLKKDYAVKQCEINSFSFDVINIGNAKSTFNLAVTGTAAEWLRFLKTVDVEANGKSAVDAYASVPCDANDADFKVTASSGTEQSSASSTLKVARPVSWFTGWFAWPTGWFVLPILPYRMIGYAVIFALFLAFFVLFLLWLAKGRGCRRCNAERF